MLYHLHSIYLLYGLKTLQAVLHMPFHLHTNAENIIFPKSLLVYCHYCVEIGYVVSGARLLCEYLTVVYEVVYRWESHVVQESNVLTVT